MSHNIVKMSDSKAAAQTPVVNQTYPPVPLDNTKAAVGVWLVKVCHKVIKIN